jgi:uncharacterized membrane protein
MKGMKHKTKKLSEIRETAHAPVDVNRAHEDAMSPLDRAALWITDRVGTMGFFVVIFAWTALWLGWNTLAPAGLRFDPFPGFVLWLFMSNMIQIFLMPLIMIGQNLQGRHSELRAEEDFEINKKAELEIETILQHLENQNELILRVLERMESRPEGAT